MTSHSMAGQYQKKVERAHPSLIVMILDDSGSMSWNLSGTTDPRCEWVERYSGIILKELLARCTEVSGENHHVRARYYLDIIKYGSTVEPWSDEELDIGEAVNRFASANGTFGLGGDLGGTDAAAAFQAALPRLQSALAKDRFKDSFPPIVFHLTDGESASDAEPIAQQMMSLSSSDGNVLIVNAYIGTSTALTYKDNQDFPGYLTEQEVGSNPDNLRLFRMSSVLPASLRQNLISDGIFPMIRENARLFFDVRTKEMLKYVIQVVGSGGSRVRQ
ncbi:MAG TPA: hypothetical protein VE262_05220 [Blastocatellia bacterium]|nr:hypothetical protein [Blastocatellia bacterium]